MSKNIRYLIVLNKLLIFKAYRVKITVSFILVSYFPKFIPKDTIYVSKDISMFLCFLSNFSFQRLPTSLYIFCSTLNLARWCGSCAQQQDVKIL